MINKKDLITKSDSIYIAGHNGMVGSSIYRKFKANDYNNLIIKDRKELDLLDQSLVNSFFDKERPDVVIIAAAKVGGIEANSKYPTEFLLENLKITHTIIITK